MRRVSLLIAALALSPTVFAQQPELSPQVKRFVRVSAPVVVLRGVRIIDGTGAPPRDSQSIVLAEGRIHSVGPAKEVETPAGAEVLELSGYTVIPGLVGMHNHLYYPSPGREVALYPQHAFSFPRLYIAGGVTTIRTTGSVETYTDLELKKRIDAGHMVGPRMHVTGPYLEGEGAFTPQMWQLRGPEDARETVNYWADRGVTSFKAYMNIPRATLRAAIEAAHGRGLKVTGHLCSVTFREAADLGIDDLEHGFFAATDFTPGKKPDECPPGGLVRESLAKLEIESEPVQGLIRHLVEKKVAITSTLPVFETFVPGRAPTDPRVLDAMLPEAREQYLARRTAIAGRGDPQPAQLFRKAMEFERAFVRAGGLLVTGLDPTGYGGVIAGFGDQRGVQLLVEAGFTPAEAIRIATLNGAEFLGEAERIGSIAPGKLADLVVIKGNPASDIVDIANVELVFKDGIGYDSANLIESAKGSVGLR